MMEKSTTNTPSPYDRVYRGERQPDPETGVLEVLVTVSDEQSVRLLNPRLDLWNHSPTGFEWGYGGSGPAQLALAILADFLNDEEAAVSLHQKFKFQVIAGLPKRNWELSAHQIAAFVISHPLADYDPD
ncbi:MAG: hypothetical protein KDA84_19650 [Planctomycetaceae bacterium]|nr:hypothetical protein [Planctomycetaceae bacterium]